MSGGPALNATGEIVGLTIAQHHVGVAYHPDNLVLARSDVAMREFTSVLQDENRSAVAHSPTPGRVAQEHAEATLRRSGLVQFRWIDPSPDSRGLRIRLKGSAHAVHLSTVAPLTEKDITFADVRIQHTTIGCGADMPDCRESVEHLPSVRIGLFELGARKLRDLTAQNTGKYLGIIVDGQLLAMPAIINEVTEGQLYIGVASEEDARAIVAKINRARDGARRAHRF
jgi:preprotein translocase subunit SecD